MIVFERKNKYVSKYVFVSVIGHVADCNRDYSRNRGYLKKRWRKDME